MHRISALVLVIGGLLLFTVGTSDALHSVSSASYQVRPFAVPNGGDTMASGNYRQTSSIGQTVADTSATGNYNYGHGVHWQVWVLTQTVATNQAPFAVTGSDSSGADSITIILIGNTSYDSDVGTALAYLWTVDNDSVSIATTTDSVTTCTFAGAGYFTITLNVFDGVDTGTADTFAVNIFSSTLLGDFTAVFGSGGSVDLQDLQLLSNEASINWIAVPTITPATDLDGDGILDFDDVSTFGTQYGTTD